MKGFYLSSLKLAKVITILKSGLKSENYRPISFLSGFIRNADLIVDFHYAHFLF